MVALNIKNEEAVRLAKELAERKGESMTTVVIEALRAELKRTGKTSINLERMEYVLSLGKRIREQAPPEWLARDQIAELYDEETGLPK